MCNVQSVFWHVSSGDVTLLCPADTTRWINVGLTLVHRHGWWTNVKPTLIQHLCGLSDDVVGWCRARDGAVMRWARGNGTFYYLNAVYVSPLSLVFNGDSTWALGKQPQWGLLYGKYHTLNASRGFPWRPRQLVLQSGKGKHYKLYILMCGYINVHKNTYFFTLLLFILLGSIYVHAPCTCKMSMWTASYTFPVNGLTKRKYGYYDHSLD